MFGNNKFKVITKELMHELNNTLFSFFQVPSSKCYFDVKLINKLFSLIQIPSSKCHIDAKLIKLFSFFQVPDLVQNVKLMQS